MMINQIYNINFKGIYTPKFTKFSDSQQRVFDDIKNKLKDKKNNFLVEPTENDSVKLSVISGVKETGRGLDKKFSYERADKIGRYDENHLFEIKDIKNTYKQITKFILLNLSILSSLLPIALGLIFVTSSKKEPIKSQTEKVITIAKDSLQTIKQDSLKLTQENYRIFK